MLLVGGKQQEEDFASKADLLLPPGYAERDRDRKREREREAEEEEVVGRKIIDPPNMGTKSDPKIKNTQSSKG